MINPGVSGVSHRGILGIVVLRPPRAWWGRGRPGCGRTFGTVRWCTNTGEKSTPIQPSPYVVYGECVINVGGCCATGSASGSAGCTARDGSAALRYLYCVCNVRMYNVFVLCWYCICTGILLSSYLCPPYLFHDVMFCESCWPYQFR